MLLLNNGYIKNTQIIATDTNVTWQRNSLVRTRVKQLFRIHLTSSLPEHRHDDMDMKSNLVKLNLSATDTTSVVNERLPFDNN